MRTLISVMAAACLLTLPAPAQATGGYLCKTADGSDLELALGFGHVPGAPLIGTRLRVAGKTVPVNAPQWWLDDTEMRVMLTDAEALETLAIMRVEPQGRSLDGWIEWRGKRRWIRCYEN